MATEDHKETVEGESPPEKLESGSFVFDDGARYVGEWREVDGRRQRHGKGRFVSGPTEYDGEWDSDAMHGNGRYVFASGATYEGGFSKGQFKGEGTYRWADGAVYVGNWLDGKMHGEGTYRDRNGILWTGTFFGGRYLSGKTYIDVRHPGSAAPPVTS